MADKKVLGEPDGLVEACSVDAHTGSLSPIPLIDPEICRRTAAIFRALGDSSRLQLLALLANGEMCVSEITLRLGDNLPAISQRLKVLRAERLVSTRRQGKHIYYWLADNHIVSLIENGLAHGSETDCTSGV
jgi:DNA-binding transcriptional ArsR family regulator